MDFHNGQGTVCTNTFMLLTHYQELLKKVFRGHIVGQVVRAVDVIITKAVLDMLRLDIQEWDRFHVRV
jgi:hypothetical protein